MVGPGLSLMSPARRRKARRKGLRVNSRKKGDGVQVR